MRTLVHPLCLLNYSFTIMVLLQQVLFLSLMLTPIRSEPELQISVYYEALCPDSIRFILFQLSRHIMHIENYISLELVPFGKATASNSSGHWQFECQHGPTECFLNMVHSCVTANNSVIPTLKFLNCAMRMNPHSNTSLEMCAKYSKISWDSLEGCFNSDEGIELLLENGVKTTSVTPPITFIPTITFNGVNDEDLNVKARYHFLQVVCALLKNRPKICQIYNISVN